MTDEITQLQRGIFVSGGEAGFSAWVKRWEGSKNRACHAGRSREILWDIVKVRDQLAGDSYAAVAMVLARLKEKYGAPSENLVNRSIRNAGFNHGRQIAPSLCTLTEIPSESAESLVTVRINKNGWVIVVGETEVEVDLVEMGGVQVLPSALRVKH